MPLATYSSSFYMYKYQLTDLMSQHQPLSYCHNVWHWFFSLSSWAILLSGLLEMHCRNGQRLRKGSTCSSTVSSVKTKFLADAPSVSNFQQISNLAAFCNPYLVQNVILGFLIIRKKMKSIKPIIRFTIRYNYEYVLKIMIITDNLSVIGHNSLVVE